MQINTRNDVIRYSRSGEFEKIRSRFNEQAILEFMLLKQKIAAGEELDDLEKMQYINFIKRLYK